MFKKTFGQKLLVEPIPFSPFFKEIHISNINTTAKVVVIQKEEDSDITVTFFKKNRSVMPPRELYEDFIGANSTITRSYVSFKPHTLTVLSNILTEWVALN